MGSSGTAIIVGAGVIGVTSAYALARRGWRVEIIDAGPCIAGGASKGNGRQLSYSHTAALASPRLISKLPGLALGLDPAFRLSLRPDAAFARWLVQFLSQCRRSAFVRNTVACSLLAGESRRAMDRLLEEHALSFRLRNAGKLVLLPDEKARRDAERTLRLTSQSGQRQSILSSAEAIELEPALDAFAGPLAGAIHSPEDQTADCAEFCTQLLGAITREYGVSFRKESEVVRIDSGHSESVVHLASGEAIPSELVVVAAGHEANRLLAPLGYHQPLAPMKGYSFTAPVGPSAPRISITENANRMVFTNLGDSMLVAGLAELGEASGEVDPVRLEAMKRRAQAIFPDALDYERSDDGWAGIRPMTPNSLPVIGRLSPSLAVNVGHGMLGWTLAMGSSQRLGRMIGSPGGTPEERC